MTLTEIDKKIRQVFNVLDLDLNRDSSVSINFNLPESFQFWKRGHSYSVICPLKGDSYDGQEKIYNDGVFYTELRQIQNLYFMEITVLNIDFKDNYFMIVSDMIFRCFESNYNINLVLDRYKSWRDFIKLISLPKTDIGLLGELFFLNLLIDRNISNIHSWTGPEFATHDFNLGSKFVEIKTTTSKYKNLISVNGLLQLNNSDQTTLCLIRVEKDVSRGKSLQDLVSEISVKLNSPDRAVFDTKINRYNAILDMSTDKFVFTMCNFFPVDENFPRISHDSFKNDRVPKGISYISYMVDLSNVEFYNVEQFFEMI